MTLALSFVLSLLVVLLPATLDSPASPSDSLDSLVARLLQLTNEDRRRHGLVALQENDALREGARLKAQDMVERRYFGHTDPDGRKAWAWFDRVAYPYTFAGENLARAARDPIQIEAGWMRSQPHRKNILSPRFTEFGIAAVESRGGVIVVAFFGHTGR